MKTKFACLLALLISSILISGDRVMTPEDVAAIRSVTSVKLSPDGKSIAYTLSVPRTPFKGEDGRAYTELHIWNEEAGSRGYITGEVNVSQVTWTPDGKAVSFVAKRGEDKTSSLYAIPVAGGEARKILSHKTDISEYAWTNGGNNVVFRAKDEKDKRTEELKDKGFKMEIFEEQFRHNLVWNADLSGEEPSFTQIEFEGSAFDLEVSPDGKQLALAISPTPLVDDSYMKKRIHIMDMNTGKQTTKFNNPGKLGMMRWSPDSKRLAFISAADVHDPKEGRLWVFEPDSGKIEKYLTNEKGHVSQISWRDANAIHFLWDEGVEVAMHTLELGSKPKETLASGPTFPGMSSAANRVALTGDTPTHPREVFLWEEGQKSAKRITNSNPWLDDIKMAPQEVVNFKARDGLELQGMLIRPLDYEEGKRYPLILTVHGGPEAHYRNGWLTAYSMLGQVAASRGFAVFYVNYRASTGRGVEFSKLDHGRPAMEEFDDLVDAVHHLSRNMKIVDEKKVGVTGGSYGGYATAWCSTALSEHFAAGVMFVGISDKISKAGTSDIPEEVYLVHDRHRIWDEWELFLKQSPIYHVKKARTPLLIMHGKEDPRVPPSQSMELYRHLKTLGQVPTRLVLYPGEGHGNRKAAARYDYNLRALRWFEHYLQGDGGDAPDYELEYPLENKGEEASD